MNKNILAAILGVVITAIMVVSVAMSVIILTDIIVANINNVAYSGSIDEVFATFVLSAVFVFIWTASCVICARQEDEEYHNKFFVGTLAVIGIALFWSLMYVIGETMMNFGVGAANDYVINVIKGGSIFAINAGFIVGLILRYRAK